MFSQDPGYLFCRTYYDNFCPTDVCTKNEQINREAVSIGEYALCQTSLEQVFNEFASQQEE